MPGNGKDINRIMIDFVVAAKHTYAERKRKSLMLTVIVVGVLLLFFLLRGHNIAFTVVILFFLFLVQMYKSGRQIRYFIRYLKIENENVQIFYEDRSNELIIE